MTEQLTAAQFEPILLHVYAVDEKEVNAQFGGQPMHYCMRIDLCQSILWKHYRINRVEFLKLFEEFFHNQPKPLSTEIWPVSVYGGPSGHFKERNWVEVDGRHYLLFQIRLQDYKKMRQREKDEINQ